MAFKVSPFHKQSNGSPFQVKSPLNELTSKERKAARKQGKANKAQDDADWGKKERKSINDNPIPQGKKRERLQNKADRKKKKADKAMKKANINSETLSSMSNEKKKEIYAKAKKHDSK